MYDIMEFWIRPMRWIFLIAVLCATASVGLYIHLGWNNLDFGTQILWSTVLLCIAGICWIATWKRQPYEIVMDTFRWIGNLCFSPSRPSWTMDVARGCMIFSPIIIGAAFLGYDLRGQEPTLILSISFFAFAMGLCYWTAHTPQAAESVERRPAPPPPPPRHAHRIRTMPLMNMQKNRQALPRKERTKIWQEGYDKGFEAGVNKTIVELVAEEEIE